MPSSSSFYLTVYPTGWVSLWSPMQVRIMSIPNFLKISLDQFGTYYEVKVGINPLFNP